MNKSVCLCTCLLALFLGHLAFAQNWKLKSTTPYGAGGHWENGQKIRVDASYKNGVFLYERKETVGNNMSVYSTRAEFATPKSEYAPGEDLSIRIAFTEKGERGGFTPFARVTLLQEKPASAPGITAAASLSGQAVDAAGRFSVMPSETVTLMANALTDGSVMALVYSCNGVDVVYLYERSGDGAASVPVTTPASAEEEERPVLENQLDEPFEEEAIWEEEMDEEIEEEEENWGNDYWIEDVREDGFPLIKLIIVVLGAAALVGLILLLFKKKKPRKPAAHAAPVCPSCGAPIEEGAHFCENCGHKFN